MKILITGGAGFIGSNLCAFFRKKLLCSLFNIFLLDTKKISLDSLKIRISS